MSEFVPLLRVGLDIDEGGYDYIISTNPISQQTYDGIVLMTNAALQNLRDYIQPPATAGKQGGEV